MEMGKEEIKIEIWKPFLLHCPYVHKALPLPAKLFSPARYSYLYSFIETLTRTTSRADSVHGLF